MPKKSAFRRRLGRAAAAAATAALLALPQAGRAQEGPDVTDLMARLEESYKAIVDALLIFPVENPTDEPPYKKIFERARAIRTTAQGLPDLPTYKGDRAFLVMSRQLEGAARQLENQLKKKRLAVSLGALLDLQTTCLRCHDEYRF